MSTSNARRRKKMPPPTSGKTTARGGAPRCGPDSHTSRPKPCNEKTQRGSGMMLANAGSKTRGDGDEFQGTPRRPWRNRGVDGDEPGGGEEELRGGMEP